MQTILLPDDDRYKTCHFKTLAKGNKIDPLPFMHYYAVENGTIQWGPKAGKSAAEDRTAVVQIGTIEAGSNRLLTPLHNRALEKLLEQLNVVENLFETWYERKQTYNMLISAGREMLDFVTNWRKPKYWKRRKDSIRPKTLPEAWLTYQFGVKPLIGTIDTCAKGLGQPLGTTTVSGSSSTSMVFPIYWGTSVYARTRYIYKLGCTVRSNRNPNAHLLNLGGFTTPFSTAWSVIPWGWAVDYFVNISQLLSNLEVRHPGITVVSGYTTHYNQGTWFGSHPTKKDGIPLCYYQGTFFYVRRENTLSLRYLPQLKFPSLGSNQLANLFSAIALTMKGKSK